MAKLNLRANIFLSHFLNKPATPRNPSINFSAPPMRNRGAATQHTHTNTNTRPHRIYSLFTKRNQYFLWHLCTIVCVVRFHCAGPGISSGCGPGLVSHWLTPSPSFSFFTTVMLSFADFIYFIYLVQNAGSNHSLLSP